MPIPSSPFSRYRASQLALSDGDPVPTWADETANGNDLTQGTGSRQPVLDADGLNGRPAVLFDGVDDLMQTAAYAAPLGQENTLVAIMRWVTVPGADESGYLFDGLSGGRHALLVDGDFNGWRVFAGGSTVTFGSALPAEDAPMLVVITFDSAGAGTRLWVDNVLIDSSALVGTDSLNGLTVGDRFSGDTGPLHAVVAEILVYDRVFTSTDRDDLYAYFQDAYGPFVPASPFARYRADQLALSDSDPVSTWADESGNGHDLTQATSASQPTYEAAGFNGNPSVKFDGTADFLQTATFASPLSQPNTIVLILEFFSANSASGDRFVDGAVSTDRNTLAITGVDEKWTMFANSPSLTAASGPSESTPILVAAIFNTTNSALHVDNTLVVSGETGADTLDGLTLGGAHDDDDHIEIRVAELILYDRELTSTELDDLFAYFQDVYSVVGVVADVAHGIVLGHQVEASSASVADISHGVVLGHAVTSSLGISADVSHGVVLGHQVEGTVEEAPAVVVGVAHGIVLGHQAEASSAPVGDVSHGVVLGHQVIFAVEVLTRTRPLQPVADRRPAQQQADLRPLQPTWTSVP